MKEITNFENLIESIEVESLPYEISGRLFNDIAIIEKNYCKPLGKDQTSAKIIIADENESFKDIQQKHLTYFEEREAEITEKFTCDGEIWARYVFITSDDGSGVIIYIKEKNV